MGAAAENQAAAALFEEGLRLKESGRLDEAERDFRRALQADPADANIHFELANLYAARAGRSRNSEVLSAAERELQQAVMLTPGFIAAHYNLGIVHKNQRRYEEARENFRRVLELDPNQTNARLQIGEIYERQGFFDDAESVYREAREHDGANSDVRNALEDLARNREMAKANMAARNRDRIV